MNFPWRPPAPCTLDDKGRFAALSGLVGFNAGISFSFGADAGIARLHARSAFWPALLVKRAMRVQPLAVLVVALWPGAVAFVISRLAVFMWVLG